MNKEKLIKKAAFTLLLALNVSYCIYMLPFMVKQPLVISVLVNGILMGIIGFALYVATRLAFTFKGKTAAANNLLPEADMAMKNEP